MNEVMENEVMENEAVDTCFEDTEEEATNFPVNTIEEDESSNPIWVFVKLVGLGTVAFIAIRKLWTAKIKPWFEKLAAKRRTKREEEIFEMVKASALRLGLIEADTDEIESGKKFQDEDENKTEED
jgi:hypothetical protein